MMDFAIRELRAIVEGPMIIVRLGTCGMVKSQVEDPLGAVAVCELGSAIIQQTFDLSQNAFHISQILKPDEQLTKVLCTELKDQTDHQILSSLNVTADSFYSSQGRISLDFQDENEGLLDEIRHTFASAPNITMEMETGILLYEAQKNTRNCIHAAALHIVVADRTGTEEAFLSSSSDREAIEQALALPLLNVLSKFEFE